jgi:TRAP-type C4-dicarboxylate transport system permease small subunit
MAEGQNIQGASASGPEGGFAAFISYLSKVVDPIGKYGGAIGSIALAVMMFLTVVDVLGRFIGGFEVIHDLAGFVGPVPGSFELTELLLGLLIAFSLGYCALHKGHIRVDLLLQYTGRKQTLWFDIFAYGISFLFYCVLAWQAWKNAGNLHNNTLATSVLSIPVYPFAFILVAGASILALVLLRDLLKSIEGVMK